MWLPHPRECPAAAALWLVLTAHIYATDQIQNNGADILEFDLCLAASNPRWRRIRYEQLVRVLEQLTPEQLGRCMDKRMTIAVTLATDPDHRLLPEDWHVL